jgi:hypothetical protein
MPIEFINFPIFGGSYSLQKGGKVEPYIRQANLKYELALHPILLKHETHD